MPPFKMLAIALASVTGLTAAQVAHSTESQNDPTQSAPAKGADSRDQEVHGASTTLDSVVVKGRVERLYRIEDTTTGTRTDTPTKDVPQAIQVIPQQLIDDQAAMEITDLYRNLSGVSFFSYSGVTMRGFRQDNVLFDGLRGDPYAGFSVPRLFSVNEVQVLKGSTGAMYGDGDPGGIINYTSKKPTATQQNVAKLRVGNSDFFSASLESSGPIGHAGRLRYRVGGHVDGEHGFRWNTERDTRVGEAALQMDVGETGTWLVQFTDIDQKLPGNRLRGVPVDDAGNFLTDIGWNVNEPTDYLKHHAQAVFSRFSVEPADFVKFSAAARWFRNTEEQQYHESRGLRADGRSMNREFRDQQRWNRGLSTDANAIWRFNTGVVSHKLLTGAEYYWQVSELDSRTAVGTERRGPVPAIDLFDPVYGLTSAADYGLALLPMSHSSTYARNTGIYLQDQMQLDERWGVLAGLRWERFDRDNRVNGTGIDADDITWRTGVHYAVREDTNLYASMATGFRPQSIGSYSPLRGGPFAPQRSRSWELGTKSRFRDGAINLDTAVYRIERSNLLQDTGLDPGNDGEDDLAALGLVRSQGFEVDFVADLTRNWVVQLSYSYNDTEVLSGLWSTAGNTAGANSRRFANAPRHKAGAWTRYQFPSIKSAIGLGADYMGERISLDGQIVQPYTVFDLSWQSQLGPVQLQANVKNLFDKEYAASGFVARNGHFPGEPRRVFLEMRYRF